MFLLQYFVWAYVFQNVLARNDVLTTEGDIILGGLFDLHQLGSSEKQCGQFNEIPGYQNMEAMLYALDKINNRTDVLPGIRLGTIIYDTCRSPTITADKTKEFIKHTLQTTNSSEFAGVIGPFKSANSIIVASFLRVFQIPQISYSSLSVKLSNKEIYNYFFRTVPPDNYFAEALVQLVQLLDWNYVSIVYSTGTWSETGADVVKTAFGVNNICVADYLQILRFPTEKDFDHLISELAKNNERRVIILMTIQRDSRELLVAKKKHKNGALLYFIGSLEWSNRDDITKVAEEVADGTISFGHSEGSMPDFVNYFQNLQFNKYARSNKEWVGEYWQKINECKLRNFTVSTNFTNFCSGDEANTRYRQLAPVQLVINAIEAMAKALDQMQRQLCPNTTTLCATMRPLNRTRLLEFLRNVTYIDAAFHNPVSFNKNQEVDGNYTLFNYRLTDNGLYDYVKVGSWAGKLVNGSIVGTLSLNQSQIRWNNGENGKPLSTCKPRCNRNQVRRLHDDTCCWECEACASSDIVVENTCKPCTEGFVPNKNLTACSKLPLHYINMNSTLSVFFGFMSCVGIVADFVVLTVFLIHRENKLIKASGREMCYFIFVGIAAIFMVPLACLAKPTQALCYFRRFIMGISFTICYAPLLMKMWRIHRIFKNSQKLVKSTRIAFIGRRSLLAFTLALIAIQGLFCALVFNTDPPHSVEKFYQSRNELVLECAFKKSAFTIYFVYNVLLLLGCTLYAFLTRHFPKNFNEAMVIGITMYLTCIVWIVFFATFLNAEYSIHRVYWISGCSLVTGWITLLGLFAPKIYQVLTKMQFSREMLLTWGDSIFSRVESPAASGADCPRCRIRDAELANKNGCNKEGKGEPLKLEIGFSNPTENYI